MQNQVNSFERGQARQAAQVESFGNALTGIMPTVDPRGNTRNVWTGPKNGYWTNGTGQVIDSDLSPGLDGSLCNRANRPNHTESTTGTPVWLDPIASLVQALAGCR